MTSELRGVEAGGRGVMSDFEMAEPGDTSTDVLNYQYKNAGGGEEASSPALRTDPMTFRYTAGNKKTKRFRRYGENIRWILFSRKKTKKKAVDLRRARLNVIIIIVPSVQFRLYAVRTRKYRKITRGQLVVCYSGAMEIRRRRRGHTGGTKSKTILTRFQIIF